MEDNTMENNGTSDEILEDPKMVVKAAYPNRAQRRQADKDRRKRQTKLAHEMLSRNLKRQEREKRKEVRLEKETLRDVKRR